MTVRWVRVRDYVIVCHRCFRLLDLDEARDVWECECGRVRWTRERIVDLSPWRRRLLWACGIVRLERTLVPLVKRDVGAGGGWEDAVRRFLAERPGAVEDRRVSWAEQYAEQARRHRQAGNPREAETYEEMARGVRAGEPTGICRCEPVTWSEERGEWVSAGPVSYHAPLGPSPAG